MPPVKYSTVIPFPHRIASLADGIDKSEFEYGQKQPRVLEFSSSPLKSNARRLPPGSSDSNKKQGSRPNEVDFSSSLQDLSYFANASIPVSMTCETIRTREDSRECNDEYIPTEIWNHVSAKHCVAVDRLSQRPHLVQFHVRVMHLHILLAMLMLIS